MLIISLIVIYFSNWTIAFFREKIKIDKVSVKMSDEPAHKKQKIDSKASEDTKEMTEKVNYIVCH